MAPNGKTGFRHPDLVAVIEGASRKAEKNGS